MRGTVINGLAARFGCAVSENAKGISDTPLESRASVGPCDEQSGSGLGEEVGFKVGFGLGQMVEVGVRVG